MHFSICSSFLQLNRINSHSQYHNIISSYLSSACPRWTAVYPFRCVAQDLTFYQLRWLTCNWSTRVSQYTWLLLLLLSQYGNPPRDHSCTTVYIIFPAADKETRARRCSSVESSIQNTRNRTLTNTHTRLLRIGSSGNAALSIQGCWCHSLDFISLTSFSLFCLSSGIFMYITMVGI